MKIVSILGLSVAALTLASLTACGPSSSSSASGGSSASGEPVTGTVSIDGSSTVTPIMEAVAEEFQAANPDANTTVGTSGTGGGFKKFLAGDLDIAMASRPISDDEVAKAAEAGIEYIEIPVALDGLTVVTNAQNTAFDSLTVAELKKIWAPGSTVNNWSQVRAGFPSQPIKLYGAGTDSGTFDYFTLAVNGEEGASRTDYQASEDDNVLVQGVTGDTYSLGYFGYAYYLENKDKLKAVKIDNGSGPVEPTVETIASGEYQPFSRPLFIYVNKARLEDNAALQALLNFLFDEGGPLVEEVGYIALPSEISELAKGIVNERKTGTRFKGAQVGVGISEILSAEGQ